MVHVLIPVMITAEMRRLPVNKEFSAVTLIYAITWLCTTSVTSKSY